MENVKHNEKPIDYTSDRLKYNSSLPKIIAYTGMFAAAVAIVTDDFGYYVGIVFAVIGIIIALIGVFILLRNWKD